jgi:hypothetical protein
MTEPPPTTLAPMLPMLEVRRNEEGNIILYDPSTIPIPSIPVVNTSKQSARLFNFQERAAEESFELLFGTKQLPAVMVEAPTGTGKTYMAGRIARAVHDSGWCYGKTYSPFPIMYVTRASVVEQTARVLKNKFGLGSDEIMVTNYDKLRSTFGEQFLSEVVEMRDGEPHVSYKWHINVHPIVIFWDEAHALKNPGSLQSKVQSAFNEVHSPLGPVKQIFFTATPGTCILELRYFICAARVKVKDDYEPIDYTKEFGHSIPVTGLDLKAKGSKVDFDKPIIET